MILYFSNSLLLILTQYQVVLFRVTESIIYHPATFVDFGPIHFKEFFTIFVNKTFRPPFFRRFQHQDSIRSVANTLYIRKLIDLFASRSICGNIKLINRRSRCQPQFIIFTIHWKQIVPAGLLVECIDTRLIG